MSYAPRHRAHAPGDIVTLANGTTVRLVRASLHGAWIVKPLNDRNRFTTYLSEN